MFDRGLIGRLTSIAGNAATATKLFTARTINGVSFDGTANIQNSASGLSDGVTGTGAIALASGAALANPTVGTQSTTDNSTKAASTAYVTTAVANAVAGVNPAVAVEAATTANVSGYTYANGVSGIGATLTQNSAAAVVIDGYTLLLNDRILFKNQSTAYQNGVYTITTLGTGIIPAIFTRALDYNQPSEMNNTGAVPVVNGTVNALTSWLLSSTVNTVGSDSLTYTQFSQKPASSGVYASKPASPNTGTQYFATDLGTAGVWITYDGTKWKPIGGSAILLLDVTAHQSAGTGAEANYFTATIPAGLLSAHGALRFKGTIKCSGTTAAKSLIVRHNSTSAATSGGVLLKNCTSFLSSAQLTADFQGDIFANAATNAQIAMSSTNGYIGSASANALATGTIDTTAATYLNFNMNGNASDTLGFQGICIEWLEA